MRGGKRAGAGRPQGAVAKVSAEARKKAAAEGVTPLDYMLSVMRDSEADVKRRDAMAVAASPFLHPRLSNVEHKGEGGGPIKVSVVRFDHASK